MQTMLQHQEEIRAEKFYRSKKFQTGMLVFLIVALGFFLRIYNIDHTPPGVYPDEAVNGIDANNANQTGDYQWFYPDNQGREGLFMNIIAMLFKFFGISPLTLKLPAILFGTLTIWGVYLLTKELFTTRAALISAFLTSVGFWAINFNRISFRANMLPFILVFAFYFLFKGLRTKKYSAFIYGGLIFGLGLHTYIAFRVAPAILIVALISLLITRQNFLKEYWKHILTFAFFVTLAAAPMLYTLFYAHPEYMESRSGSISIMSPQVNKGDLPGTFLRSFALSLVKYNFWGDQNWRHNFPPYPILDTITGIAFLFGFIFSFIRMFYLLFVRFWRKERNPQMDIYIFLVAWFFIMLAPEFMTAEGNPHALRAIGTLPVVFIFAGLAFEYLFRQAQKHSPFFQKIFTTLVVILLISVGIFNTVKYHVVWANRPETAQSFEKGLMTIAAYLKTVPAQQEKYIVTGNMQRIPIRLFNMNMPNLTFLYPGQLDYIQPRRPADFIIIYTERNDTDFQALKTKFPGLQITENTDVTNITYFLLHF